MLDERGSYVDVVEGQHDELGVRVPAETFTLKADRLARVGDHVSVSERDALGHACGALITVSQYVLFLTASQSQAYSLSCRQGSKYPLLGQYSAS